ncbi:MAG TPA: hypothetical protein DCR93_23850 [Cytophagales bacterium]|nr:hypothetical protein [Cytophagales bacterium]
MGSLIPGDGGQFTEYLWDVLMAMQPPKRVGLIRKLKEPPAAPKFDIAWYGPQWKIFLKALRDEDCSYWAEIYEKAFTNNFQLDKGEYKRRQEVPEEIKNLGPAAVGHYLERLKDQLTVSRLNEARILILGDKGVGKTTLARKLIDPNANLPDENESTKGVDTTLWDFPGDELRARIWDFAGHVVTHAAHQFFLSERCLYVLVYDGRTDNPERLKYWLNHMKNHGGNSEAVLVVNLKDPHQPQLPINTLQEQYHLRKVFWLNLEKDNNKLEEVRSYIHTYVREHPTWKKTVIGDKDYAVKQELEQLFGPRGNKNGEELISKEQFERIVQKHQAPKPEQLLSMLHSLGVSFWYPDLKGYDTLILNPEWITDGLYAIINWLANKKEHCILSDNFPQAFADQFGEKAMRFPKDKHAFLYDLILQYELAYERDLVERELLFPHLLQEDQPKFLPQLDAIDSLLARFRCNSPLPTHIVSRFIVRHHRQIKNYRKQPQVWRYGVVLEGNKGNTALVRVVNWQLEISVKGPKPKELFVPIMDTLKDIFEQYKAQDSQLEYKIFENRWFDSEVIRELEATQSPLVHQADPSGKLLPLPSERFGLPSGLHVSGNMTFFQGDAQYHDASTKIETNVTFNFQECNVGLQTDLGDLITQLKEVGAELEAKELATAQQKLAEAKEIQDQEKAKIKMGKGLYRFLNKVNEEGTKLNKLVKGLNDGVSIAQDIAQQYNQIADWTGLPQVPKAFLKGEAGG